MDIRDTRPTAPRALRAVPYSPPRSAPPPFRPYIKATAVPQLRRLVSDYLASCQARGLMPKSLKQYRYALESVFLPGASVRASPASPQLDQRQLDRFTASLAQPSHRRGRAAFAELHPHLHPADPPDAHVGGRDGETVTAKPQLPRREHRVRDVLSREEIDRLEAVMSVGARQADHQDLRRLRAPP